MVKSQKKQLGLSIVETTGHKEISSEYFRDERSEIVTVRTRGG